MSGIRALCVYSEEDDEQNESSCPDAASATLRAVNLPGGHHFGGDYDRVAELILEQLR
jgi:type IV secretory pathway VirJ component